MMPNLDAQVACEHATCSHPEHQCNDTAVWRVRVHGARPSVIPYRCADHLFLLCDHHLTELQDALAATITARHGASCGLCGRPYRRLSDIIRVVSPL